MRIMEAGEGERVKRKILIDLFEKNGWTLKRHGAGHDIYVKGSERETVPRHSDIDEMMARAIIKRRNLK